MPSIAGRNVTIPEELKQDRRLVEGTDQPVVERDIAGVVRALLAIFIILLGTAGIGVGVGTWVHPGAGLAAASAVMVAFGVLLAFQS